MADTTVVNFGKSPEEIAYRLYQAMRGLEEPATVAEHLDLYRKCLFAVQTNKGYEK